MSEAYISPQRIPTSVDVALLTPAYTFQQEALRQLHSRQAGSNKPRHRMLADSIPVFEFEQVLLVGPFLGTPAAALIVHSLARSGIKRIVLVGSAGGLMANQMQVGDLVFPRGYCLEHFGSSRISEPKHVESKQASFQNSIEQALIETDSCADIPRHAGIIWTSDTPLAETSEKATAYRSLGCVAVDMEYGMLFASAEQCAVELAGVFIISDLLEKTHKVAFRSEQVQASKHACVKALLDCITTPRLHTIVLPELET